MQEAVVAQLVERVLGKDEVTSSILVNGSSFSTTCPTRELTDCHFQITERPCCR